MLNHAAALTRNHSRTLGRRTSITSGMTAMFVGALALAASSATALDAIDLSAPSAPSAPTAAGECSQLVQIKYPFLDCANGQIGQSSVNETWTSARHMPMQSGWIEGDGYWGPTLNPVDAAE